MSTRLYVIGNGFDRAHGIPSSYSAFGTYVKIKDRDTFRKVEEFLFGDDNDVWANFEANLANLDVDGLADHASMFLGSYADEDFRASAYHDYQWAVEDVVSALSTKLHAFFVEWLVDLSIPDWGNLNVDRTARFLNFNYTPTLQRAYRVPETQVLHIHGRIAGPRTDIILGHGMNLPAPRSRHPDDEVDFRIEEGERIMRRYFKDTAKPTAQVLRQHANFFDALTGISEVWVMGHSLGDVDVPYFQEIVRRVLPDARWKVSYYGDPTEVKAQAAIAGIPAAYTAFVSIDQF